MRLDHISDDRETKQLKMVEEIIHQSQLEMRALLLHLRPVALKGKTLQEGMQELLVELSQKVPMDIKWKIEPIPLDKGVEDHLISNSARISFKYITPLESNVIRSTINKTGWSSSFYVLWMMESALI